MESKYFNTNEENTWCSGCPNFAILKATKDALAELTTEQKINVKDIVMASGVGCHAKIFDYINVNGFYGLHGRVLPLCFGMKVGNPDLTVIGFGGDGDTYAEGMSHFIHNCRYNADFTMIVHNNKVFALTTGQATPTSHQGFIGKSTPLGMKDKTLNPISLALVSGASFVARAYALDPLHLKEIIKEAVCHKGFSLVDVLQPCITFNDFSVYLKDRVYKLDKNYDCSDFKAALEKSLEWDYSLSEAAKVPTGIFYKEKRPVFKDQWPQLKSPWYKQKKPVNIEEITKEFL